MRMLAVPVVLVVTVLATAECSCEDSCHDSCVPQVSRDAAVTDAGSGSAPSCPAEPDSQGQCPTGCEVQYAFC